MNKNKNTKDLKCKVCGDLVKGVGDDAIEVTCWKCTLKTLNTEISDSNTEE